MIEPDGILIVIVLLVIVLVMFFIWDYSRKSWKKAWIEFARRTSLNYDPSPHNYIEYDGDKTVSSPVVTGNYCGRPVVLGFNKVDHGEGTSTYTRLSVGTVKHHRSIQFIICPINKTGASDNNLFELDEVRIGDEEFDRWFIVHGFPRDFLIEILSRRELRQRLESLDLDTLSFWGHTLYHESEGVNKNAGSLHMILDFLCYLAAIIERDAT